MTRDFAAGNYSFLPSVFQYSGGAAAHPGFEIERVRFAHNLTCSLAARTAQTMING